MLLFAYFHFCNLRVIFGSRCVLRMPDLGIGYLDRIGQNHAKRLLFQTRSIHLLCNQLENTELNVTHLQIVDF